MQPEQETVQTVARAAPKNPAQPVASGPADPLTRALYLREKMMQSPEEQAEMKRLLSDKQLLVTAKQDWLAQRRVTPTTDFLIRSLEWKENPSRPAAINIAAEILLQRTVATAEQQSRQAELAVALMQNAPQDFKTLRPQMPGDLIQEAKEYFHRYSRN
jgi:hypothetical protein